MDSNSSRNYLTHLAWIIPTAIAIIGLVLDHMDKANLLFSIVWNYLFVNIWYLWCAAAGYGLYWVARLIQNLHKVTNNVLPTLTKADAENMVQALKLVQEESASRVSATDTLSNQINSLDTRFQSDLDREVGALHAKLDEQIGKEVRARTDGINAINHRLDLDFERMNKIEISLPQQVFGRINEIEAKLAAQISTLNKRVQKAEPSSGLDMATAKRLGILNTVPRVPTPEEAVESKGQGIINSARQVPTPREAVLEALIEQQKNRT